MDRKGFAPIIILLIVVAVVILAIIGFRYLGNNLAGGGGSDQVAPDSTQVGQPTVLQLIVDVWGGGGPINGRYTDMSLYYKLDTENAYQVAQPQAIPLPENYQKATSATTQWEAYQFTIPPYPTGTIGEIDYYYEMKLDGVLNHVDGVKKIQIVPAITTVATSTNPTKINSLIATSTSITDNLENKFLQQGYQSTSSIATWISGLWWVDSSGIAVNVSTTDYFSVVITQTDQNHYAIPQQNQPGTQIENAPEIASVIKTVDSYMLSQGLILQDNESNDIAHPYVDDFSQAYYNSGNGERWRTWGF